MSDIEINSLNKEKGTNGSNNFASRKKHDIKSRRCMDFELHNDDHLLNNIDDHEEPVKNTKSSRLCDPDSDEEDTFAEADSECEPNQFFLEEMLEDTHPERLNLLDYRKEDHEKKKGASSSILSLSDRQHDEDDSVNDGCDDDSSCKQNLEDSTSSIHDVGDEDGGSRAKINRSLNVEGECESTTERSDGDDTFGNLPTIKDKAKGRPRLDSLGTSAGVGPGRPLLRQASQKAVWGK